MCFVNLFPFEKDLGEECSRRRKHGHVPYFWNKIEKSSAILPAENSRPPRVLGLVGQPEIGKSEGEPI